MPQMAPISWLILFIVFTIAFMLFNVLNYYCFNYSNSKNLNNNNNTEDNNKNKNNIMLNWKW